MSALSSFVLLRNVAVVKKKVRDANTPSPIRDFLDTQNAVHIINWIIIIIVPQVVGLDPMVKNKKKTKTESWTDVGLDVWAVNQSVVQEHRIETLNRDRNALE